MARYYDDSYWPRYVTAAERRHLAAKEMAALKKAGRKVSPVVIAGRKITTTFWGDAWCTNLEAYSDYANRLPRGRTYVRNGSVIDLQIEAGRVRALVSGTDLYTIDIEITPLARKRWDEIKGRCAGQIGSLVELLRGSISRGVMEIVTRKGEGLFPAPREITLSCSCPDWATMCKHVAATLYGVGARLDHQPELLFTLRGVEPTEMIEAAVDQPASVGKARKRRKLEADDLSSIFGVDIDMDPLSPEEATAPTKSTRGRGRASGAATRTTAGTSRKTTTRKPSNKKPAARKATTKATAKAKETTTKMAATKKTAASGKPTTAGKKAAKKKPAARKTGRTKER